MQHRHNHIHQLHRRRRIKRLPKIPLTQPQLLHVRRPNPRMNKQRQLQRLTPHKKRNILTHQRPVRMTHPIKPHRPLIIQNLLKHRTMNHQERPASRSRPHQRIHRIMSHTRKPVMAVIMLHIIKNGWPRDTSKTVHAVIESLTLSERQTTHHRPRHRISQRQQLVQRHRLEPHIGIYHKKPVAFRRQQSFRQLVPALRDPTRRTLNRRPTIQPAVMGHIPTHQSRQALMETCAHIMRVQIAEKNITLRHASPAASHQEQPTPTPPPATPSDAQPTAHQKTNQD